MDSHEFKTQSERMAKYKQLSDRHTALQSIVFAMTAPYGQHKCSAFTGNTRESRRVVALVIEFSETSGGEPAVEMELRNLHIPASEFGTYLKAELEKQAAAVRVAMEKL